MAVGVVKYLGLYATGVLLLQWVNIALFFLAMWVATKLGASETVAVGVGVVVALTQPMSVGKD